MDDEWVLRRVRVPKGTHLSKSKDTDGAERDLLREDGTNKLLGPAESISVDEDDDRDDYTNSPSSSSRSDREELTLGESLVVGLIEGFIEGVIEGVRDADVDWAAVYENRVAPSLKRRREAIARRLRRRPTPVDDLPEPHGQEVEAAAVTAPEQGIEEGQTKTQMTEDEYRERLALLMMVENAVTRERKVLATAQITSGAGHSDALARAIRLVLDGRVNSLRDDEWDALMGFLDEAESTTDAGRLLVEVKPAVRALPSARYERLMQ